MKTSLIIGTELIFVIYKIIEKVLTLIEWNMKYNVTPVEERRVDKWNL